MLDAKKYLGEMLSERYFIKKEIGRGASSVVFYAEDMLTPGEDGRPLPVAIKLLDKDSGEYKLNSKTFQTEIRAVVNMPTNPHVVDIHDVSFSDKEHYIVMEFVRGRTLSRLLAERDGAPFSPKEIISVALQILQALRNAHEAGVVHRDIKPQNILVQSSADAGAVDIPGGKDMPYIKVADFGIALLPDDDLFAMKNKGVGTVHYISPEQAAGGRVDARSDLYSLGVVMYEMATGHVPFDARSTTGIIQKHQLDEPFHVRTVNPDIPLKLDQIIFDAMQKSPAARFRDASAMEKRLKEVLRDISPEEREKEVSSVTSVTRGAVVITGEKKQKAAKEPRVPREPKVKQPKYKEPKVKEPRVRAEKPKKEREPIKLPPFLLPVGLGVLGAAALVVGVILLWPILFGGGASGPITVPYLVGTYYSEDYTYPDGITVNKDDVSYAYDENIPVGMVISQSPGAGAVLNAETVPVSLIVSMGPEMQEFVLPKSERSSYDTAKRYLEKTYTYLDVLYYIDADTVDDTLSPGYVMGAKLGDLSRELALDGDEIRKNANTEIVLVVNPTRTVNFSVPEIYRFSGDAAKTYVEQTFPFFAVTVESRTVNVMVRYHEEGIKEILNNSDLTEYLDAAGNLRGMAEGYALIARLSDGTDLSLDGVPFLATENGIPLKLIFVTYNEIPQ